MNPLKNLWRKLRIGYYKAVSDARKYPRVALSVKVTNQQSGVFSYYQATNISLGGMYLKADEPLPSGTPLDLAFSLPEMKQINVRAIVARVHKANGNGSPHPSGMGIKFTDLHGEARGAIDSFVRKST